MQRCSGPTMFLRIGFWEGRDGGIRKNPATDTPNYEFDRVTRLENALNKSLAEMVESVRCSSRAYHIRIMYVTNNNNRRIGWPIHIWKTRSNPRARSCVIQQWETLSKTTIKYNFFRLVSSPPNSQCSSCQQHARILHVSHYRTRRTK